MCLDKPAANSTHNRDDYETVLNGVGPCGDSEQQKKYTEPRHLGWRIADHNF
jgi:hypothetical protein